MRHLVRMLRFLIRYARSVRYSRAAVVLLVLSGILSGAASAAFIAVINSVLSRLEERSSTFLGLFIALAVALPLLRFVSNVLLLRLSNSAVLDLRLQLSRRILAAPLRHLEEMGAARVLAALTQDVAQIVGALTNLPLLLMHATVVLGCFIYMGWLSISVLAVVLAAVIVGVSSYQLLLHRAQSYFSRQREVWDALFQLLRGLTEGTKELKMHRLRRQVFIDEHLLDRSTALMRYSVAGGTLYSAAASWGQSLFFVLIGVILFALPASDGLDREILTGYALAILYLMTPLDVILQQLPVIGRASVSIHKLQELGIALDRDGGELVEAEGETPQRWHSLRLAGVVYTYRGEKEEPFTVGPLDLSFEPGELVFFIGGNGSGKTTLGKLLLGLYHPSEGQILLDDEPITRREVDIYRQQFSAVFTDSWLFENLMGLETGELDRDAGQYLRELQLEDKVRVEAGRLSTLDLSQGQRKRLALLTAYLEDRPIYLFDEWAADQDPQFRKVFYHEILPSLKQRGKTVFVISHDDRYFGVADRLIKLDRGRVEFDMPAAEYLAEHRFTEVTVALEGASEANPTAPQRAAEAGTR